MDKEKNSATVKYKTRSGQEAEVSRDQVLAGLEARFKPRQSTFGTPRLAEPDRSRPSHQELLHVDLPTRIDFMSDLPTNEVQFRPINTSELLHIIAHPSPLYHNMPSPKSYHAAITLRQQLYTTATEYLARLHQGCKKQPVSNANIDTQMIHLQETRLVLDHCVKHPSFLPETLICVVHGHAHITCLYNCPQCKCIQLPANCPEEIEVSTDVITKAFKTSAILETTELLLSDPDNLDRLAATLGVTHNELYAAIHITFLQNHESTLESPPPEAPTGKKLLAEALTVVLGQAALPAAAQAAIAGQARATAVQALLADEPTPEMMDTLVATAAPQQKLAERQAYVDKVKTTVSLVSYPNTPVSNIDPESIFQQLDSPKFPSTLMEPGHLTGDINILSTCTKVHPCCTHAHQPNHTVTHQQCGCACHRSDRASKEQAYLHESENILPNHRLACTKFCGRFRAPRGSGPNAVTRRHVARTAQGRGTMCARPPTSATMPSSASPRQSCD